MLEHLATAAPCRALCPLLAAAALWACAPEAGAARGAAERTYPGLAFVLFNDTALQRPREQGIEGRIDMELQGYNDCSKLWLGQIRFPAGGEVTLAAEADNGVRLFLEGKAIIEGWSPDGARRGKVRAAAGRWLPLRVEYYQEGGPAFLRLYWEWKGHARELVPASALRHTGADRRHARAIAAGEEIAGPGNRDGIVFAPTGKEPILAAIYGHGEADARPGSAPIRLRPGPHLFIDDFLIESTSLTRRVNRPQRDPGIPNPIITGKEDHCFQPYMTVLRDASTGRFRVWYGVFDDGKGPAASHVATMESEDGIHWARPHRVLRDPSPIQFGDSVLDEGPGFPDPTRRYKLGWWMDGGLQIAASPDGLDWRMLAPGVVLRHNHDITNIIRDTLRNRYVATLSVYTTGPTWEGLRRATMQSTSQDLVRWGKPWYILTPVDGTDEGQTQFYAMNGHLIRGDLWVGLVKVLRDDLRAGGTPEGSYGIGYTTLAWTRDGKHWTRDREPFFEPDPQEGAWDHAHAWMDWQLPVGDQVYLYYGGYKNGHKVNRFEERQIGVLRIPRDRYVSRDAGETDAALRTPAVVLGGARLTVNADVAGEVRVRLCDADGRPLQGFGFDDCAPITGDSVSHPVRWSGGRSLPRRPVHLEFAARRAHLYGFDLLDTSARGRL